MNVNVVIAGHVDHGKSTLIGRLLYDSDSILDGRLEEIQKLAEEYKRKFEFAYFLDAFDDEVKESRTIDTTGVMFKGKNLYTITDVPGHKEFIKNMLTGASHADIAVLMVAADEGIREQTRRHAFLIQLIGIKYFFAIVNKMDMVDYSKDAFEKIKAQVEEMLSSFGYVDVQFIPASAMEGDNIYNSSQNMDWYDGPTLIETLDSVELETENLPTRFIVQDIYDVDGEKITVGRVESGALDVGDKIVFQPSNIKTKIEKITKYQEDLAHAEKGDSVGLSVEPPPQRGDVCGVESNPPVAVTKFLGETVLLEDKISRNDKIELRCGTKRVQCKILEIREKIDTQTGEPLEKNPDSIGQHESATILFETDEPIVVEKFSEIPPFGRFILVKGRNIAAGVVLEVMK